ncbi:hypothetical protein H8B19_12160 [Neptunicella marina]|uniref:Pullulanase n=1 Tax=Neptunicella marina TaxID=2125989 RepID=A0A8J6IUM6_9ALTE|nr:hypothetical protein [Neptunicella marina]
MLSTALLNGCAATSALTDFYQPKSHDDLYLRGGFTWWEADEAFKVEESADNVYSVKTELIADGQPYEFRFVDKDWTEGSNCGYLDKSNQIIEVNVPANTNCNSTNENFRFTPPSSGLYEFSIDFTDEDNPLTLVKKVN